MRSQQPPLLAAPPTWPAEKEREKQEGEVKRMEQELKDMEEQAEKVRQGGGWSDCACTGVGAAGAKSGGVRRPPLCLLAMRSGSGTSGASNLL